MVLGPEFADVGLAVFRIIVGAVFVAHALPKIESPESTREFFSSVGLPDSMYIVYLAIAIEVIAGTLLAVGLYTQFAALLLVAFMGVASFVAIVKMDKRFEGGYEVDLLLLGAAFLYFVNGPGKYAMDTIIRQG